MSGVNFGTTESKALQLGNNKFEQGTISVAAKATVKAGTILKRDGDKKFAVAVAGDAPVGLVPFDMVNDKDAAKDLGFRAIIGGEVRRDMVNLNGAPITSVIADSLRDRCGIIAVDTTDVSRVSP
ncbi:MAG: hypothetical protein FWH12_06425 [Treponema sp.]|nr:hypothetical protein [Treponema sp.]